MTWPTKDDFVDGDVLTAAQVNNIANNLNEADPTGITDGYVLTADGAGAMGWEAAGGGYEILATASTTGTGAFSLTGIPQTKTHLLIYWNQTTGSSGTPTMRWNNSSASVYNYVRMDQGGSTVSGAGNQTLFNFNSGWPDNTNSYLYIPFYTLVKDHNAILHTNRMNFLYFESQAAISEVNFLTGLNGTTTFTVYGI